MAILSQIFKYIFILIIYLFIFTIIRMIYLDIRSMQSMDVGKDEAYLKVVNRLDSLNFKMQEYYVLRGLTKLGRSSKNDIVIKDNFVSKNHLLIEKENGQKDASVDDQDPGAGERRRRASCAGCRPLRP